MNAMPQITPNTSAALVLTETTKARIHDAMPAHVDRNAMVARFAEFALQCKKNPALENCSPESVVDALVQSARLGVLPDGKFAAIVPRKVNGTTIACFDPMFRGLMLAVRNSLEKSKNPIVDWYAEVVLRDEDFEEGGGTARFIKHTKKRNGDRRSEKEVELAYSVVVYKDGTTNYHVCTEADIKRARASSTAKTGPWSTDFGEMAKKTAIKAHCKMLPLDPDTSARLDAAMGEDDPVDTVTVRGEVVNNKEQIDPARLESALSAQEHVDTDTGEIAPFDDDPFGHSEPQAPPEPEDPPGMLLTYGVPVPLDLIDSWDKWKTEPCPAKQVAQQIAWERMFEFVKNEHVDYLQKAILFGHEKGELAHPAVQKAAYTLSKIHAKRKRLSAPWDDPRRFVVPTKTS